ncbi:MAG: hypothetical protein WC261_02130, partial [Synergistaceae bacterium]
EPWTVLVVWVLVNGLCYLYRLVYVRRNTGIPMAPYVREVIVPIVLITLLALPLPLLSHYMLARWTDLVVTTMVSLLITGILVWLMGLKPTEKKHIKEFVKRRLS